MIRKLVVLLRSWATPKFFWTGTIQIGHHLRLNVPVRIDGIGDINIGDNVSLGYVMAPCVGSGEIMLQARDKGSVISIGDNTFFSNNVSIVARKHIQIGLSCLIGDNVSIVDADFHEVNPERRRESGHVAPVYIGDNVWLGSRVMVLKGVSIGDHSVIAAGAIVTSDIPPRSLAAGIPARVIKSI
jgi:maltose O-acetyltransferase